jgi:Domain of unknown function (DUF5134)
MIATVSRCGRRTLVLVAGLVAAALRFANVAAAEKSGGMTMSGGSSTTHTSSTGSTMPVAGSSASSMAHTGSTAASHMSGMHSMSMGSMSMTVGGHTTNILPNWLAVLWMLAFFVIIAIHGRHVLESEGQRRWWHSGHVFMALGMAVMFAPASVDHFNIPPGFWSLAFTNAAIAIVLWMMVQAFSGRGTNLLWLLMAFDLGAMAYMWSPSGFQAPITWLLVAYFAGQAVLWGTNRMRNLDERTILGGAVSVTPEGALAASVAEPLICYKDLRVSMAAMTLGMAYMFAAMQLVMS